MWIQETKHLIASKFAQRNQLRIEIIFVTIVLNCNRIWVRFGFKVYGKFVNYQRI